jgi:hypothetical protein
MNGAHRPPGEEPARERIRRWAGPVASHGHGHRLRGSSSAVYLGFFATRLSIRLYGGSSYDDNGYLPLDLGPIRVEPNTLLFSVMVLLHTVAALLITGAG